MYSLPTISLWSGRYSGQRVHIFLQIFMYIWYISQRAVNNTDDFFLNVSKIPKKIFKIKTISYLNLNMKLILKNKKYFFFEKKWNFWNFWKLNEKQFSSGLRGRRRTYHTILKLADHALGYMVRYVFMQPLRPELDGQDSA
jgi:hypothetical protein